MNRFAICLLCSFVFMALQACAQVKITVVNSSAFYMIPSPGTIAVDEKGNELPPPRDSVFYLYVETKGSNIQWERAWKDGRSFSVLPVAVNQQRVQVGTDAMKNRNIQLSPASGNTLWQIELSDDLQRNKPPKTVTPHEILLKGIEAGRPVYVTIKSLTQIASPEYQ